MRLSCSWSVMRGGSWRMAAEDGRRRRTEGSSWAAAVEPACHLLEDRSWVVDDDSRTADNEPPATCCVDGVTHQLTRKRVSCNAFQKAFLEKSFVVSRTSFQTLATC